MWMINLHFDNKKGYCYKFENTTNRGRDGFHGDVTIIDLYGFQMTMILISY